MKANELMIGDWVYFIHTDKFDMYTYREKARITADDFARDSCILDAHYTPIPLTPEILEKNGWKFNDLPFVQGWEQYGITIVGNRITCGQNVSMKVEYVHELQHALKLCGIEIEIKL